MAKPIRISILADASQATKTLNNTAGKLAGFGKKALKVAGGAGIGAIGVALKKGFDRLSSIEQAEASLDGLGHSAKSVDKIMGNALASVKNTAFGLGDAAGVAAGTVAAGVKPGKQLERTLKLVGDAATIAKTDIGSMGSIFNKVAASDMIQGDVLAQLGDRGIPILQLLSKELGVSTKEVKTLASKGKIDFATFQNAMESGMGGAAQKSGSTMKGAFANAQAAMGRFGAGLLSGVYPKVRSFFNKVPEILDEIAPKAEEFAAKFGDGIGTLVGKLKPAFDGVKTAVEGVVPVFERVIGFMRDNPATVKAFAITLGVLATAIGTAAVAVGIFNAVLAVNPITIVVVGLAALVAGLVYCYQRFSTFRSIVDKTWAGIKAATQAAWPVIRKTITTVVDAVLAVFRKVFPAIAAVVKTYFNIYKTVILTAINVIKKTISSIKSVVGVVSSIFESVKSAISSKLNAAITFVKGIPGRVKGAFGSAKSILLDVGKDIMQGLLDGIEAGWKWVKAKLDWVTDKIPDWKGPAERDKRLLTPTGRMIMSGLVAGLRAGEGAVRRQLRTLTKQIANDATKAYVTVEKFLKKRDVGQKRQKKILTGIKAETKALLRNSKAHERVSAALTDAKQRVEELKKAKADYAASIRDAFVSFGSIASLGEGHMNSVGSLVQRLRDRVAAAQRFASLIDSLRGKLNATSLQQLIDAGVEGGMAAAEALASGGSAAISEVNALTAKLVSTGQNLGNTLGGQFYDSGIQAAQGLINGLKSKEKVLINTAKKIAKQITKAIKKALKERSPSRATFPSGVNAVLGLVVGMGKTEAKARKAGASVAKALQGGLDTARLTAPLSAKDTYASTSAHATHNTYEITVNAPVGSNPAEIGREVRRVLDAYESAGGRRRAA